MLRCAAFIVSVTPRDGREPARQFRVDSSTNQYTADSLRPGTVYAVSVQPVVNERPCPGMTVDMTTDVVCEWERQIFQKQKQNNKDKRQRQKDKFFGTN